MTIVLIPGNILVYKDTDYIYTIIKEDNRNVLGMWQASSKSFDDPKIVKTLLFVGKLTITSTTVKHQIYTFLNKKTLIETDFYGDADTFFLKKWEIVC